MKAEGPQSIEHFLHSAGVSSGLPGNQPLVRVGHGNSFQVLGYSGPAALGGHGPSYSYVSAGARFAQESSLHFDAFEYLFVG